MKLTFLKDVYGSVFSLLDTFQKNFFRRKLVSAAGISPDTISIEDLWSPSAY